MTEHENAIRTILLDVTAAWDAGDADAFVRAYAPDAVVVLPGDVLHRDREEIRTAMAKGFAGPLRGTRGVDEPELVRVGEDGRTATVVSRTGFLLPHETELPAARSRRAVWTLRRDEGRWLVTSYANTPLAD